MKKILDRFDVFCKKHWFACDMFVAAIDLVILLMPFWVRGISDPERYTFIIIEYGICVYSIIGCGVLESIIKLKKDVDKQKML